MKMPDSYLEFDVIKCSTSAMKFIKLMTVTRWPMLTNCTKMNCEAK